MSPRAKDVALLVAMAAAGAALIAFLILRSGTAGGSPLDAVPEDAFLVASVDVRAIGGSPLGHALVGDDGARARALGMDAITEACGWNPLYRVRAIAIAVPEGGERGDFGLAATSDIGKDEGVACARAVIRKRGGNPEVTTRGSFAVVEDVQKATSDAAPEIAFRGGLLLLGRGPWLARMIDVAERHAPSLAANAEHRALRDALRSKAPAAHALVVSAVLPKPLRDRLRVEMAGEATDASSTAMSGVLGVASAGLALDAGHEGGDASLDVVLRCETEAACAEVQKLVEKKRFAWSRDVGLRLVGLGPLVDHLVVDPPSTTLHLATRAPADTLAHMVERAGLPFAPRGRNSGNSAAMPPRAPKADEVIPPPHGDGGARHEDR